MFDLFDGSKLLVIGIVALIVIGPKDLPRVLRQLGQMVTKLRRMSREFQSQFMDAMREAELDDIRKDVEKAVDSTKLGLDFNPVADIKREISGALSDQPATVAAAPQLDLDVPDFRGEALSDAASAGVAPVTEAPVADVQSASVEAAPTGPVVAEAIAPVVVPQMTAPSPAPLPAPLPEPAPVPVTSSSPTGDR